MNDGKVKDTLAKEYGAEYFRFGYPFSSHKNDHVERQIRTVKSVLHNILFEHKDKLTTLFQPSWQKLRAL